jgi:chloramphenicol-sensitive protein RarD
LSQNTSPPAQPTTPLNSGILYAILAYGTWGFLTIYWKFFNHISPVEVLSHRMIWSMVFLGGILLYQGRLSEVKQVCKSTKTVLLLLLSASLLTFNWGMYIYGVNTDRVLETGLGYFINPLVSVLLGCLVLRERLHWAQLLAVMLATIGVVNFAWGLGSIPWIALALAFSFALYGLLRKMIPVSPMVGLMIETGLISPLVLIIVTYWGLTGQGHFGSTWPITLLFMGAGIVTSMPLLWFNNAAKRLKLSTVGFFQYIAPSIHLLLGVFMYHEPFTPTHAVTFGLIWSALILFSLSSLIRP